MEGNYRDFNGRRRASLKIMISTRNDFKYLELCMFLDFTNYLKDKLVDQSECGTNHSYLIDFIQIPLNIKLLDFDAIRKLFVEKGLSSVQIARKYGVSKTVILSGLHRLGIRVETPAGRTNNPENYRLRTPPYGYRIQEGRLVPNKSELRICRMVVELMARKGLSGSATARELGIKGYKNRNNSTKWDHSTVRNIFERWKNKL